MKEYMIICAKSSTIAHINYHFTQFGEIVDYLDKKFPDKVLAIDCDAEYYNLLNIIKQIIKYNLKSVSMYVTTENLRNSLSLSMYLKRIFPNIHILVYGVVAKLIPNIFLNTNIDAVYKDGDFETCIESFFNYYSIDNSKLEGMYIIDKNNLISTNPGKYISSDEWGFANPHIIPVDKYIEIKNKNRFVINISKGCPYNCKHCLISMSEGCIERRRSILNLKNTISKIYPQYTHIKLWAANFTLDEEYVYQFCNIVKESFPKLTWECATRIDLVNEELLNLMYNSGCKQITFGVETLNEEEWIKNTKSYDAKKIDYTINIVKKANIKPKCCIMLGIPGQTKKSIYTTIEYLVSQNVEIRPTIFTPYHLLDENVSLDIFDDYNKKTFNAVIDGITYKQLISLLIDIKDYKNILK